MAESTITLLLDSDVLRSQPRDSFCISRKVNGAFTTVFQDAAVVPSRNGQQPLYQRNEFRLRNQYKVFGAVQFRPGMMIQQATDTKELGFGQQTEFRDSDFQSPSQAPSSAFSPPQSSSNSFIAKSFPSNLAIGVQCQVGGSWASIYVDPGRHNGVRDVVLTPSNEYAVFWSGNYGKESMIDDSQPSRGFQFTIDGNSKTIRFGYRTANQPEPGESPSFYSA